MREGKEMCNSLGAMMATGLGGGSPGLVYVEYVVAHEFPYTVATQSKRSLDAIY